MRDSWTCEPLPTPMKTSSEKRRWDFIFSDHHRQNVGNNRPDPQPSRSPDCPALPCLALLCLALPCHGAAPSRLPLNNVSRCLVLKSVVLAVAIWPPLQPMLYTPSAVPGLYRRGYTIPALVRRAADRHLLSAVMFTGVASPSSHATSAKGIRVYTALSRTFLGIGSQRRPRADVFGNYYEIIQYIGNVRDLVSKKLFLEGETRVSLPSHSLHSSVMCDLPRRRSCFAVIKVSRAIRVKRKSTNL